MSILFGEWNFDRRPVDPEVLSSADALLEPYAPDAHSQYKGGGIVLTYYALHTTAESRLEKQPFVSASGAVFTWDGRLDNREELIRELRDNLTKATDVEIVAVTFARWGTGCFAKLIGDWAVAIWDPSQQRLILAKDFAGVRPLYYLVEGGKARWSSVLDPLVTLAGRKFKFNEEYAAGWLAMYPSADTTPYAGIDAVPPCSFVTVNADKLTVVKYWDFDPGKRIRYRTDAEYEEHFRDAFQEAVRRRLRADRPICCELSGGMDSTSITCMADLVRRSSADVPEIYTISFYSDSEPHADERPYFSKVEEKLGRTGCHIDIDNRKVFEFDDSARFVALPGGVNGRADGFWSKYKDFIDSTGIRVVLSGIGGDEMIGGVPSPTSELQDLFVQLDLQHLAHKLKLWALAKRKPWFHLVWEALSGFLPPSLIPQPKHSRPPAWLLSDFIHRHHYVLGGFNRRVTIRGPLPSMQANLDALDVVRRQLSCMCPARDYPYDKRYPFLDRTLLEFLFAIPRQQILEPGFRRSVLRRALKDIVPSEVLERRRKAYATRGPRAAITQEWDHISDLCRNMIAAQMGILSESSFSEALLASQNSDASPLVQLMRTIVLEAWLRNVCRGGVMSQVKIANASARRHNRKELDAVLHETTFRSSEKRSIS